MAGAWLGFAAVVLAALLALYGVLRSMQPPKHQADIDGFKELLAATRRDRDDTRQDREAMRADREALRELLLQCQAELAALREQKGDS